ncbi:MAG: ATP-binding cassette domain-containing protein [Finegoldia magna]|uniref:ABC transporter ATP-binding protein n=1 Tax=Finegoldia magna TaxID=1260 RepID=UPI0028FE177C|nr:ATP-binding cassette domain-containing protein [Finegoldia magna]MDU3125149.1 ATP-binding cassette domain-containing protein [Finegoldia magna]MDU5215336.1 ATP-binding cassette domain-containing protein [Finegoldia magna]
MNNILEVRNVNKSFKNKGLFAKEKTQILKDVSITIPENTTVGLVGESGSGKSTLANIIMGLLSKDSGVIIFDGKNIDQLDSKEKKKMYNNVQIVFQDPYSSLDPSKTVFSILDETLKIQTNLNKAERNEKVRSTLKKVGIQEEDIYKRSDMFSGGQRQRISIARAIIVNPKLIIFDEPTSALDVSIQAQILNLLSDIQVEKKISYLFISHNLDVIRHICDEVYVMNKGEFVESGLVEDIYNNPQTDYTKKLLESIV